MPPDIEFSYNSHWRRDPPAAFLLAEFRSPASPNAANPERLPALIDTGADCCAIPQNLIDSLRLCQVAEVPIGGYNDKEENLPLKPVYSIHLTIPPLQPRIVEVIPRVPRDYAIIGRNIINDWLLTLDGPNLKAYLKSTIEST